MAALTETYADTAISSLPQPETLRLTGNFLSIPLTDKMGAKYIAGPPVVLSSAGKLPMEMLSEVFIHCLDHSEPYTTPNVNSAPLLLTRVCKTWRACATMTPCLWTSFKLYNPTMEFRAVHDSLTSLASLWLERSGARTLSLSLTIPFLAGAEPPRSLSTHVPRSRHLHLSVPASLYTTLHNVPMLFLETLSITFPCQADFPESNLITFSQAPELRSLVIEDLTNKGLPRLSLPWSQLTELRVDGFEPTKGWLEVLRECTALKSCTLIPGGEVFLVGGEPTPIAFPELETLRIHPKRVLGFIYALDHFDVPALRHLEISIPGHIVPLFRELAPLLKRSECQLESLSVNGFRIDAFQDFTALCELMPSLKRLEIDGIGRFTFRSKQIFEALTCKVDEHGLTSCLLPRLEAFNLHLSVGPEDFPEDAIKEMFDSRSSGFKDADIHLQRRQHDWIASLVNKGTRWYTPGNGGTVVKENLDEIIGA
ncbi:hypothetical protein NEOLEDRAFT_1139098 [Neolentinus lepideus HHB14362 ss-1]|uniref:F-box domain-containing protein n=1 Tax=Neolentinus lepideus HHB14362 ss-1 TaxID=1314782 RepID=A0A165PZ38_9AGAM|nr:hypothetical protein NEOLEDRAFT_1139098 [Neolentinus lepideus HHB14362 ss-1]